MYSPKSSTARRVRLSALLLSAAVAVSLAGCYGESEFSYNEELANEGEAESIQFGDAYWSELAQEYDEYVPEPGIGAAIDASEWINKGRWGDLIEWPEIAVGAANMLDGRIVTWASEVDDFFGDTAEVTTASIFNPLTETFEDAGYSGHNLFCAGISMLPDGRVFLAGGGVSVSTVSVFEDNQFREIDSMAMARWYPTSTTLPSGQVLTSLGTTVSGYSELWTDGYGWQVLDNVDIQSALEFPYYYKDWYPALNVAPDGSLFHPGPNNELFSLNLEQDNAYTGHGEREVGGKDRLYNTTVVYDVGKMLIAGGGQLDAKNTAITIDLNGTTPVVNNTSSMQNARTMQNSVVLPNGEVLVIGGNSSGKQFSDDGSVVTPELWNPDSGQWSELAPHQKPRNYHSTALLLQDGRVISMGGGLCGACRTNHQDGEIFEPPYLFTATGEKAARPIISTAPGSAFAGDSLDLEGSDNMVEFNMVRLMAMTHHHATDQRLVPVEFTKVAAGSYQLQLNANANVLIPGYYWIFGLDQNGVPSTGHQIQVKVSGPSVKTPATTETNINYAYYEGGWETLPDFGTLTPVAVGTQSDFSLNNRQRNGGYGFVFTGSISVPTDGIYTFYLSSDDGSRLSIDGRMVINHDGKHRFELEKTGTTFLSAGQHAIKLEYFENNAADGLLLSWSGPGVAKRPVTKFDLGSEVVEIPVVTPQPDTETPTTSPDGSTGTTPDTGAEAQNHVAYRYYEGNWNRLPNFESLVPVKTGQLDNISLSPKSQANYYAFQFDVRASIEVAGAYTFFTRSDDGSRLYVDDQLVVDNDGLHPAIEKAGVVTLAAGEHDIRVEYFEKAGGDSLEVLWSGPGVVKEVLPEAIFVPPVAPQLAAALSVDKMQFELFEGTFSTVAEMNGLVPDTVGATDVFDLDIAAGVNRYGVKYSGKLQVDVADTYSFSVASDDGAQLFIDGAIVIDNDGRHPVIEKQNVVELSAGLHDIKLEYFQSGGGADLQVRWSRSGQADSAIPASALYSPAATAADVTPAVDVAGAATGYSVAPVWSYDLYDGSWPNLPDFEALTPTFSATTSTLDLSVAPETTTFALRFQGTIEVNEAGLYTFYTSSDDGSRVVVNDQLVADNDGRHAAIEKQGQIALDEGVHDIELTYFQGYGGLSYAPFWSGPSFAKTRILPGDTTASTVSQPSTGQQGSQPDLPASQLSYQYFEGAWSALPDFGALQPIRNGQINNFLLSVKGQVNQYGVRFDGLVKIDTAGTYQFYVLSNDGSRLTVAGEVVVDNDGRHGAIEKQGSVTLQPGYQALTLDYFQNGGSEALKVYWSGPGFSRQLIPDGVLFDQP